MTTNNDKVKTIFRLLGELAADSLFPVTDADTSETAETVPDTRSEPNEEIEPSDPEMWLSVGDLMRLDCLQKRSSNDKLREMSRQEFADYRADPASRFPQPKQQNGHRKYWQLHQIDTWIDDDEKLSVDQFIACRRAGV